MEAPALDDDVQVVGILEQRDVGRRVPFDHEQIGEIAGCQDAELVAHAHQLTAQLGGGDQRLGRRVAEQVDEQGEVVGVAADRVVREAVVTTGHDADSPLAELRVELDHLVERPHGTDPFGSLPGDAELLAGVDVRPDDADARGNERLVLGRLEQVDRLRVGVGAVIDQSKARSHGELDRLGRLAMRSQPHTALAGLVAGGVDFLDGVLGDLTAPFDEHVVVAEQQLDRVVALFGAVTDPLGDRARTLPLDDGMAMRIARVGVAFGGTGLQPRPGHGARRQLVAKGDLGRHLEERSGGEGGREPGVEQDARVALGPGQFRREALDVLEEGDVEGRIERRIDVAHRRREREVGVRFDQPGNHSASGRVDDVVAVVQVGMVAGTHLGDPLVVDDDLTRLGRRAGAVEDEPAGDDSGHVDPLECG